MTKHNYYLLQVPGKEYNEGQKRSRNKALCDRNCAWNRTGCSWNENYFFALSRYADRLLAHINEHPEFIVPASRKAEVLGFLRQGLRDFSVSRLLRPDKQAWGIPVPGDLQHVIYVWFDALTNYLTAIGFPDDQAMVERYWPGATHVIGKDVIRFHCLYWPAMLMAAGLPLPRQIAIHGFLTL